MTRFLMLAGFAVLSLAACSDSKGPGALGSKDDIVIRNNGLPQAQQDTADFSSTVEQGEAVPAPDVAPPEPIEPPVTPVDPIQSTPPISESVTPAPASPQAEPVSENATDNAPLSDPVPAPPVGQAIAPTVSSISPEPAAVPAAPAVNVNDPAIILAVQTAMRASGVYTGKLDGEISTGYLNALSKYQAMHQLPQGGLNDPTLRHMRLIP